MWADIDYMDDYKIFTISQSRYSRLPKLVEGIRAKNMTFVPIMDAGVAVRFNEDYEALTKGLNEKIFIKQAQGEEPLTAGVWCGDAYFPDYYNPATTNYWHDMFDYLKNTYGLEFDGIWLDMNEATNFCDGYCKPEERPKDSLRNKAYYVPG
jgi:alpha-glucosidase (family GH31 glycosyl hydrolase)